VQGFREYTKAAGPEADSNLGAREEKSGENRGKRDAALLVGPAAVVVVVPRHRYLSTI
jgi:hypothetical protein